MPMPIAIPGEAPYDTWTWIPVPGTECANGTTTGLGINPKQGASRVLFYYEGGGLCWDQATCAGPVPTAQNLTGYDATNFAQFAQIVGSSGPFDRADNMNPFHDATFVILPYCTGDLHVGSKTTTYGATTIHHSGYTNTTKFLERLVPTFANAAQVIVAGSSAGGFGAAFNFGRMHDELVGVNVGEVILVDDSGPLLRPPYTTKALQQAWKASWGMAANLPAGCAACDIDSGPGGGVHNVFSHYAASVPGFRGSLITSDRDNVVSAGLSLAPGDPNLRCAQSSPMPPCEFHAAVYDLQTQVTAPASPGKMHVFYMDSYKHIWLSQKLSQIHPSTKSTTLAMFLGEQVSNSPQWADVTP